MTAPSLADLERAVEEEWERLEGMEWSYPFVGMSWSKPLLAASRKLRAARRAARDAGYVSVLVSREAVEAVWTALTLRPGSTPRDALAEKLGPFFADAFAALKADGG